MIHCSSSTPLVIKYPWLPHPWSSKELKKKFLLAQGQKDRRKKVHFTKATSLSDLTSLIIIQLSGLLGHLRFSPSYTTQGEVQTPYRERVSPASLLPQSHWQQEDDAVGSLTDGRRGTGTAVCWEPHQGLRAQPHVQEAEEEPYEGPHESSSMPSAPASTSPITQVFCRIPLSPVGPGRTSGQLALSFLEPKIRTI